MTVEIVEYDARWAGDARRAVGEVLALGVGGISVVEHVGSTAVPGLAAKPVIDLMAATGSLAAVLRDEHLLGEAGYRRWETGMPERLFYRREGTPVAYHLHVVTEQSWPQRNERLLRDHLLGNPADRELYGRLKRELAAAGHDVDSYTRAKTTLIQRMVDDARAARGLPSVDVWEE